MMATAYPPQPRAVPVTTSRAIQMPQGYPLLRLLTAPMPKTKRQITATPPMATSQSSVL